MQIEKNTVVTIDYKLQENDPEGNLVEQTHGKDPLIFLYGHGMMLSAFEENLLGKAPGDTLAFSIQSENAYGPMEQDAILDIPVEQFTENPEFDRDQLRPGSFVTLQDTEGRQFRGIVKKVSLNTVNVDFNHPMAGVDLFFTVDVKDVRAATETEVEHGHVHHEGEHHH